jgi:hypothetical protein
MKTLTRDQSCGVHKAFPFHPSSRALTDNQSLCPSPMTECVTAVAEAVGDAGNGTRRCDDDQVRDLRRGLGGGGGGICHIQLKGG